MIALWALTASSEAETNQTSKAEATESGDKSEPTKMSLQDRPREGRKDPQKKEEKSKDKDDEGDDESKEESSGKLRCHDCRKWQNSEGASINCHRYFPERQVRSRVPYGYKPGIQGGPRGLPHAPVNFATYKRVPSENQSDFSQPLYEKNHKRLHPSVHSTRLNVSASEGHKTEAQQESPDVEHVGNNAHDSNRASAPADQPQNPLLQGPPSSTLHEDRGIATKSVLRPPPAIRPLPHNQVDQPFIGPRAGGPLVGRGPVYPAHNHLHQLREFHLKRLFFLHRRYCIEWYVEVLNHSEFPYCFFFHLSASQNKIIGFHKRRCSWLKVGLDLLSDHSIRRSRRLDSTMISMDYSGLDRRHSPLHSPEPNTSFQMLTYWQLEHFCPLQISASISTDPSECQLRISASTQAPTNASVIRWTLMRLSTISVLSKFFRRWAIMFLDSASISFNLQWISIGASVR